MCSTPAPPSTFRVAHSIWSGVGEVNTSPGQAASSIPMPTNPPCIGSCPHPPPDTTHPPPPRHRPVPPPAPGHQRHLPLPRRIRPVHHKRVVVDLHQIPVRQLKPFERLPHEIINSVDQLLHAILLAIIVRAVRGPYAEIGPLTPQPPTISSPTRGVRPGAGTSRL